MPHSAPEPVNHSMIVERSYHGRVVLIGDSAVGKTSILNQLFDHNANAAVPTVGANYQIYVEEIDGVKVEIQIWDTAGQETYRSLAPIYFRNARAAIAVYDVTSPGTLEALSDWVKLFRDVAGEDQLIFVVGNKIDLVDDRKVSRESARQRAESLGVRETREVSAKTGEGVEDLFTDLARKLIQSTTRVEKTLPAQKANGTSCC